MWCPFGTYHILLEGQKAVVLHKPNHLKDGQSFKPVLSSMDNWRLDDFCEKSTTKAGSENTGSVFIGKTLIDLTNQLFAGKQDGLAWNGLNQKHGTLVLVQNDININVTWMHINIAHLCSFRIEMGTSQHCSRLPKLTEPIGTQLFSSPTSPPQCFTKNSGRNWKWHFNSPREFTRPSWCCCQPKVTFSSRTAVRTWWVPQHSYDGLEANHKVSPMGRCQNPQDSAIFSNSRPFVLTFRTAGKSTSKKTIGKSWLPVALAKCFRIDIASAHATRVASALSALAPPFAHPQVTCVNQPSDRISSNFRGFQAPKSQQTSVQWMKLSGCC